MRRVELLKYHDYITYIIDRIAERLYGLLRKTEDELTAKAIKHIINILEEEKRSLWFSTVCKKIFNGYKIGITDLDKIFVVNGELKALVEYKWRKEDFERAIPVNAFQFITLQELSKLSEVPLYYIVEIGEYDGRWFRVAKIDPYRKYRIKRCGNGDAKDTYSIIKLNNTTLMNELEFKSWLKEVMANGKH
ncbi:hypothetical protein [Archaeoglobus sp.]